MSNESNLCQELEICVFSGNELSPRLNDHACCCERCRIFLEQNKKLENDLKALNLTGIGEGEIADKVISRISEMKKSRKPKFNFTHHFGTAAALIIICAVAIYTNNNPNQISKQPVKADNGVEEPHENVPNMLSADGAHFEPSPAGGEQDFGYTDNELSIIEEYAPEAVSEQEDTAVAHEGPQFKSAVSDDSDGNAVNDAYDEHMGYTATETAIKNGEEYYVTDSSAKMMMFSPSDCDQAEKADGTAADAYVQEPEFDIHREAAPNTESVITESAQAEEAESEAGSIEAESDEISDSFDIGESLKGADSSAEESVGKTGSSGGSGGGSSSAHYHPEVSSTGSIYQSDSYDDRYFEDYLVFQNLQFLPGDENFDSNIDLANNRLAFLYGENFCIISRYALENNGWGGNNFFFEYAPSMTYGFIVSLENSSRPITEQ